MVVGSVLGARLGWSVKGRALLLPAAELSRVAPNRILPAWHVCTPSGRLLPLWPRSFPSASREQWLLSCRIAQAMAPGQADALYKLALRRKLQPLQLKTAAGEGCEAAPLGQCVVLAHDSACRNIRAATHVIAGHQHRALEGGGGQLLGQASDPDGLGKHALAVDQGVEGLGHHTRKGAARGGPGGRAGGHAGHQHSVDGPHTSCDLRGAGTW